MRRTGLLRRTPLRRKTRLRARSKTNSYRRRERDLPHMKKVKTLPCVVRVWGETFADLPIAELNARGFPLKLYSLTLPHPTPCTGRVKADHAGDRPKGWKAADSTVIPMCNKHHHERTDMTGTFSVFAGWDAAAMRAWCEWALRYTRDCLAIMSYR